MPSSPPVSAPAQATSISSGESLIDEENARIISGASFCQVDKINAVNHEIDIITDGYHMWNGAAPILISSADMSSGVIICVGEEWISHIDNELIISNLDPSACARKYLIAASVSWNVFECSIRGINLSKLSSNAAHTNIQLEAERAIMELISIMVVAKMVNGDVMYIKTWQSWTV